MPSTNTYREISPKTIFAVFLTVMDINEAFTQDVSVTGGVSKLIFGLLFLMAVENQRQSK